MVYLSLVTLSFMLLLLFSPFMVVVEAQQFMRKGFAEPPASIDAAHHRRTTTLTKEDLPEEIQNILGDKELAPVLQTNLESLSPEALDKALQTLVQIMKTAEGANYIRFNFQGDANFVDPPEPDNLREQPVPAGPFPYADTFKLHSNPGAATTVYLDFNGHQTINTIWNEASGIPVIDHPAYDTDGDPTTFSNDEMDIIQNSWRIVAEDFAPFDVDVTTEEPANFTNPAKYPVGHVVITDDWEPCGCGGFAYVGTFDDPDGYYSPAFVFNKSLKGAAEASTHEIGHNLGLVHDGIGSLEYYEGHGSGATSWAPIMGVGYFVETVTWSKGEYTGASNTEDDIAIIQSYGMPLRSDDVSPSGKPLVIDPNDSTVATGDGIIERDDDTDLWTFTWEGGDMTIEGNPRPLNYDSNLDIQLQVSYENNAPFATINPLQSKIASETFTARPAGMYTVTVDGVGVPSRPGGTPLGYTDYGSLGFYQVKVTGEGHPDIISESPSSAPSTSSAPSVSTSPSAQPSVSTEPSAAPSITPSITLSSTPSAIPSAPPSNVASSSPSVSTAPSTSPSVQASAAPTELDLCSARPGLGCDSPQQVLMRHSLFGLLCLTHCIDQNHVGLFLTFHWECGPCEK